MRGISMGTLNYPGPSRIEKYQLSFFQDSPESFVELPWLNLLCYLPLHKAKRGLPTSIGYYTVLRCIYDKHEEFFQYVIKQLKEIFPYSFLFQEYQEPYQYCKDCSDILTIERLKILSQQMTVFDFSRPLEEEMILAELMRVVWRETQMPKQRMTHCAFDYENALPFENYQKLTWFIPFNDRYPVIGKSVKRYLVLKDNDPAFTVS